MCESSADCRTSQHVCDQGICWGNPPNSKRLAAILMPPANRPDLAPTELTNVSFAPDGTKSGLTFSSTILLHGRVTFGCNSDEIDCPDTSLLSAQIIVERASTFTGGPRYKRTVLTTIEANKEEDSFSIALPMDSASYRVTVIPDEYLSNGDSPPLSLQVPPFSTVVQATQDIDVTWNIGSPDQLQIVQGCITNILGSGERFAGMRVHALGRWPFASKLTRASAVVRTNAQGCFEFSVPIAMEDEFDIIARPDSDLTLPTLRLHGETIPDPAPEPSPRVPHVIPPLQMPDTAPPIVFHLPLRGRGGGGDVETIPGATVVLDTQFEKIDGESRNIDITYSTQTISNSLEQSSPGVAVVQLYPGSIDVDRHYRVQVYPPPDSEYASIFDGRVVVNDGKTAPFMEGLDLNRRFPVSGVVKDSSGSPSANVPLRVQPSQLLRSELTDATELAILDNLQFPSTLTGDEGEFLLWLDDDLLGLFARYDFEFSPPDFSSAPRWVFEDIAVGRQRSDSADSTIELALPYASYVRGIIRDSEGLPVPAAEIRWFQIPDDERCAADLISPNCESFARLIGIWESDESGSVISVLPDPDS